MKISYNWLQKYFDSKLPDPKQLADLFTVHTFEVENLEKIKDDTIFEFKVLPDRAHYLLSHKGVAREIAAITGLVMNSSTEKPISDIGNIQVEIQNPLCRRYIAVEMKNIEVSDSPNWLKNSLEVISQRSINNIVDLANYLMLDLGQPIHIFDADRIDGHIEVRSAREGEKIILLTGEEVTLKVNDLVIADSKEVLAIAGIKGGKKAEINSNTKRIIIEAANFDPVTVRKTSTYLNLRNDSSKRFENEITPQLAEEGINKLIRLIQEVSDKANVVSKKDIYPNPVKKWQVQVNAERVSSLIGIPVSNSDIKSILERMDCEVNTKGDDLIVTPPFDRLDIVSLEDVADEIGRIIGYEKLSSKLPPNLESSSLPDKVFFYSEKVKNILTQKGYSESILYSLVPKGFYEIIYPLAKDKSCLRTNLQQKLSEALVINGRNADLLSLETVKMFEVGNVFLKDGEKTHLAIGVLQVKKKKDLTSEKILKEDIENLEKSLGISLDYKIVSGEFGALAEFDFNAIVSSLPVQENIASLGFESLPREKKYKRFSQYPFVVRDIALFVPENVKSEEIEYIIKKEAGDLLVNIRLFDVFKKDFNGQGKISYAFRLIFQSKEKTLNDSEVNIIMDNVTKTLNNFTGFEVR